MLQQTIQEVKFEDIILSKKQQQAKRTNKLRHWLEYLNMLDENSSYKRKKQIIYELHNKFILKQQFWLRQINRIFQQQTITVQDFQFIFLSLQDGFYQRIAKLIVKKLYEYFIKNQLRTNFVIAKLQLLLEQFNYHSNLCAQFFEILIQVYKKSNNKKKIRETYKRNIQLAQDNFDLIYLQYLKWQKKQNQIDINQLKYLFTNAKQKWQSMMIFKNSQLQKIMKQKHQQKMKVFEDNKIYIKIGLIYLQNRDIVKVMINQQMYLNLLKYLPYQKQRLYYLRRMALSQNHFLVQQYFETLQKNNQEDQFIISNYKNTFNWSNLEEIQYLYLLYLVRRINKHLITTQNQEYNNSWGQKVQFFRNQVSQLIQKKRFNPAKQKQLRQKYYNFWIQVQTALIKDSASVSTIYQNYLAWGSSQQLYLRYAQSMIKLGDIKKAKFIFNKTFESFQDSYTSLLEFQDFLQIYGSLDQIHKIRQKINQKNNQIRKQFMQKSQINLKNSQKLKENNIMMTKNVNQTTSKNNQMIDNDLINKPSTQLEKSQKLIKENKQSKIIEQPQETQQRKKIQKQSPKQKQQLQSSFKRSSPANSKDSIQKYQQSTPKKRIHTDLKNTLFAKNIKKQWKQSQILNQLKYKEFVAQIRIIQKDKEKICYIQFNSEQVAQKQLSENKSQLQLYFSKPPSKSDDCTLFLCNISQKATKKEILQLIPQNLRNEVKQIRLKQKNYKKNAYIQFNNLSVKDKVLNFFKMEKIKLHDKNIIVMNCDSDNFHKDKKGKTLFLKNLSFKCNQNDIRNYFEQNGIKSIQQIYIPKQSNNKPKGYAYVWLKSTQQFQHALEIKKATLLKRQFTITRSDRAITYQNKNKREDQIETRSGSDKKTQKKSNNFFKNMF